VSSNKWRWLQGRLQLGKCGYRLLHGNVFIFKNIVLRCIVFSLLPVLLGMLSTGVNSRDSCTSSELVRFITTSTEAHHFDNSAKSTYLRSAFVTSVVMLAIHPRCTSQEWSWSLSSSSSTVQECNVYIDGPSAWTHTCHVNLPILPSREELKRSICHNQVIHAG
jgi:hypothetical protein